MDETEIKNLLEKSFEKILNDMIEEIHKEVLKTMCMFIWTYRDSYMRSFG